MAQLDIPEQALAALSALKLEDLELTWEVRVGSQKSSLMLTWERKKTQKTKPTRGAVKHTHGPIGDRGKKMAATPAPTAAPVFGPQNRKKSPSAHRRDRRRRAAARRAALSRVYQVRDTGSGSAEAGTPPPSPPSTSEAVGSPDISHVTICSIRTAPSTTRRPPPSDEDYRELGLEELAGIPHQDSAEPSPMETDPPVPTQSEAPKSPVAEVPANKRPFSGPPTNTALVSTGIPATRPVGKTKLNFMKKQSTVRRKNGIRQGDIYIHTKKDNAYVLYRPSHGALARCFYQEEIEYMTVVEMYAFSVPTSRFEKDCPDYMRERISYIPPDDKDGHHILKQLYDHLEETIELQIAASQ